MSGGGSRWCSTTIEILLIAENNAKAINLIIYKILNEREMQTQKPTSVDDANESFSMLIDVLGDDDGFSSVDLSADLRTAPTRSFAKRDHDSIRLCANQQAAGPRPLIVPLSNLSICCESFNLSSRPAPIVRRVLRMTFNCPASFLIQRKRSA